MSRQLSDFLTVATQQIPGWALDLMNNLYERRIFQNQNFSPFAFSFATRRSFIFCTSFGRDRALM